MFKTLVRASVLSLLGLGVLAAPSSAATISVTPSPNISGGGADWTWSYSVSLIGFSSIDAGDFFTIFDFAGLIPASATGPAGWTFSSNNLGTCPTDENSVVCAATDSPVIANLTWTYNGAGIANPNTSPATVTPLGTFAAHSLFGTPINDNWVSQDNDLQTATANEGAVGNTNVPVNPIPEPATLLLLGGGLLGLARSRRRAKANS